MSAAPGLLAEVEAELGRITGRRLRLQEQSLLREELGLDSMHLIQLAVWAHERCGVNLGQVAEQTGKQFLRVRDLLEVLEAP